MIEKPLTLRFFSWLWKSIDRAVKDSRKTAIALNDILRTLGEGRKASNPFKKALKQLQLEMNADDILNIRSQIHTHSSNLQIALQAANL